MVRSRARVAVLAALLASTAANAQAVDTWPPLANTVDAAPPNIADADAAANPPASSDDENGAKIGEAIGGFLRGLVLGDTPPAPVGPAADSDPRPVVAPASPIASPAATPDTVELASPPEQVIQYAPMPPAAPAAPSVPPSLNNDIENFVEACWEVLWDFLCGNRTIIGLLLAAFFLPYIIRDLKPSAVPVTINPAPAPSDPFFSGAARKDYEESGLFGDGDFASASGLHASMKGAQSHGEPPFFEE